MRIEETDVQCVCTVRAIVVIANRDLVSAGRYLEGEVVVARVILFGLSQVNGFAYRPRPSSA